MFNDLIDEEGPITIGNLDYNRSTTWEEIDPIAYRAAFLDYCDAEDITTDEDEADEDEDEDED